MNFDVDRRRIIEFQIAASIMIVHISSLQILQMLLVMAMLFLLYFFLLDGGILCKLYIEYVQIWQIISQSSGSLDSFSISLFSDWLSQVSRDMIFVRMESMVASSRLIIIHGGSSMIDQLTKRRAWRSAPVFPFIFSLQALRTSTKSGYFFASIYLDLRFLKAQDLHGKV